LRDKLRKTNKERFADGRKKRRSGSEAARAEEDTS
jgi:hypothetical protein